MANHNRFRFDIPNWLIFLAFVTYWPAGIILLVLRSVSSDSDKKSIEEKKTSTQAHTGKKVGKEKTKQKKSPAPILLGIGAVLALLGALVFGFGFAVTGEMPLLFTGLNLLPLSITLALIGGYLKKNQVRLDRIRAILENRSSMNLSKLAAAGNTSLKQTRKDVQKLIDMGVFGKEAYIDLGANNFMRNSFVEPDEPDAFDYRTVYGNVFKENKEDTAKGKEEVSDNQDDYSRIIREIRRLNDDIKDVAVSYRIEQIEGHTRNIFDYVTEHPEAKPQIRTFMNYYLPTTLKLLESYYRIERVGVAGENMKKSKANIENTLDLLVVGFEQQVDQLFKNEFIDISSDITVLETMMKKDGLHQDSAKDLASLAKQYSDEVCDSYCDDLSSGGAAACEKPKE